MKSVDTDSIDEYLERMCAFFRFESFDKIYFGAVAVVKHIKKHVTRHTGKTHVKRVANSLVRLAKTKQFMTPQELMPLTDIWRNFHGDILSLKYVLQLIFI